jgi:hypothetical protein
VSKPRDYAKEYREYQGTPKQLKAQAARHRARRLMIKKHGKAALRGKDVDHKDGNPHNNRYANLRIRSISSNRGDKSF